MSAGARKRTRAPYVTFVRRRRVEDGLWAGLTSGEHLSWVFKQRNDVRAAERSLRMDSQTMPSKMAFGNAITKRDLKSQSVVKE